MRGADRDTLIAVFAAGFKVHKLGLETLGFRIAAPKAIQRTPFEKHGCADARTILNRKSLYVKYHHGLAFVMIKPSCHAFLWRDTTNYENRPHQRIVSNLFSY